MRTISRLRNPLLAATVAAAFVAPLAAQDGFRFRSTTELINVTATVTDASGRFVSNLRKEDFVVREDGQRQQISHFSSERVPVSLGIVLDVSGSMSGEKFRAAQSALDRFMYDLLAPEDEVFILAFSDQTDLVSNWTTDRQQLANGLRRIRPRGGTALYDAVAEAVPMAQGGAHKKKAVVVISDGNDTDSSTDPGGLQSLIRETEVLVYAIGIDGTGSRSTYGSSGPGTWTWSAARPVPLPVPVPGRTDGRAMGTPAAAHAGEPPGPERRGERGRAARHHRRQRRPHRGDPLRQRPRSGHREHRRRAVAAVLDRLRAPAGQGRPMAPDRGRGARRPPPGAGSPGVSGAVGRGQFRRNA